MSDTCDSASEASSSTNHEHCPFHDDPRDGLCGATTYEKKTLWKYKAKNFLAGYFPVCNKHDAFHGYMKSEVRAGRCQAIEECGQLCHRLAKYAQPYHFCKKHQNGTSTLPCHLLQLPTELRLMIFRYLFPKVVFPDRYHGVKTAILKTNRQIQQEASSVLYGESHFQAIVQLETIWLQGKDWRRMMKPATKEAQYPNHYSVVSNLCENSAKLIQNLDIQIEVGMPFKCPAGIRYNGITSEEFYIYLLRHNVRTLLDHLVFNNTAKHRKQPQTTPGFPAPVPQLQVLRADHKILKHPDATDFEPMPAEKITSITERKLYGKLREQWQNASKDSTLEASSSFLVPSKRVQSGFLKIEAFFQLLHTPEMIKYRSSTSDGFKDMEFPLHLARVAYDNNDLVMMERIHEAIKLRWVNAHRRRQASRLAVADSINSMFEKDGDDHKQDHEHEMGGEHDQDTDEKPTPRELYLDVFGAEEPLEEPFKDHNLPWSELDAKDSAPKRGDPGVEVRMLGVRMQIRKDGVEWIRLRTPAHVREVLAAREASQT